MRHLKAGRKLGRTSAHRIALTRNLATALIEHGRIETTEAKAKEVLATGANALAARPGLASLKDTRLNAGGFLSARAFAVGDDVEATVVMPACEPWGSVVR